jgi:filamentous hemagglutinin
MPAAGPPPPSPTRRPPTPTWAESLPAAGEFTSAHLARVVAHLARPELERFAPNDAMVTAVRTALAAGRALGEAEVNFLRHQLTESRLMDGGASPQDAYEQALRTHPPARNYSPEVIDNHPGLFNNAWRRAWGMAPR